MAGGSIGTAFVDVAFDPKQIQGQIGGLGGKVGAGFSKFGSVAGLAAATGFGAAIAGGIAAGKYLYDIGAQFDDMADTIRVSTGKTGKELDSLVKTAKHVGTDVPTSFEDAGKAVSFLSQRLDVTGKPLQTMSDQLLEVSRLTGTDLQGNMNAAATALKKFGVPAEQSSAALDKVWRAAQAGQVPFADLATELTKFGTPLQAFGFNMDESLALLDSFHKAGVNVMPAMGGLTKGLAKLAKAGKDPVKGLQDTFTAIKEAKTPAEATAAAIELFGARAGPELAKAVRSGALSVDDLQKRISKGHETILKAGKDTADFSEQWQLFKNRVAVGLAPVAEKLFSGIGQGMARLNEEMPGIQKSLGKELGPQLKALGPAFDSIGNSIKSLMPVWKVLGDVVVANVRVILASVKAFADVLAGTIKVISALLHGDWGAAWDGAKQIVSGFVTYFKALLQSGILGPLSQLLGPVKAAATAVGKSILDGITAGVSTVARVVTTAFDAVRNAINSAVGAVRTAASAVGAAITTALLAYFNTYARLATTAFNAVVSAIRAVVGAMTSAAQTVGRAIVDGIMRLVNTVGGLVGGALRSAAGAAAGAAAAIGKAIVSGLRGSLGGVYGAVKGGLDRIWAVITNVAGNVYGAAKAIGSQLVHGMVDGVLGLIGWAKSKIEGALGFIKSLNPFSTVEEGGKKHIGIPLMQGAVEGVVEGTKPLSDAISKSVVTAVDEARTSIASQRDKFSASWDDVAGGALDAFDRLKAGLKTKSERLIADMELDRQVKEMKDRMSAAVTELQAAQAEQAALAPKEGETDAEFAARAEASKQRVLAAQKAVDDARYEQEKAALEKRAAQERIQLDARIAVQRTHFEAALKAQGVALATGHTNADKAQAALIKLLNSYGVKYTAAGKTLGTSFVTGLNTTIGKSMTELEALLKRIKTAIETVTSANAAVKPPAKSVAAAAPAGVSTLAAGTLGAPSARGAPSGGVLYGSRSPFSSVTRAIRSAAAGAPPTEPPPTIVRVYIGDEELRGIVRTEVGYADDVTARVVLAGMNR